MIRASICPFHPRPIRITCCRFFDVRFDQTDITIVYENCILIVAVALHIFRMLYACRRHCNRPSTKPPPSTTCPLHNRSTKGFIWRRSTNRPCFSTVSHKVVVAPLGPNSVHFLRSKVSLRSATKPVLSECIAFHTPPHRTSIKTYTLQLCKLQLADRRSSLAARLP